MREIDPSLIQVISYRNTLNSSSGAWLRVFASSAEFRLSNNEFCVALCMRYGLRIPFITELTDVLFADARGTKMVGLFFARLMHTAIILPWVVEEISTLRTGTDKGRVHMQFMTPSVTHYTVLRDMP